MYLNKKRLIQWRREKPEFINFSIFRSSKKNFSIFQSIISVGFLDVRKLVHSYDINDQGWSQRGAPVPLPPRPRYFSYEVLIYTYIQRKFFIYTNYTWHEIQIFQLIKFRDTTKFHNIFTILLFLIEIDLKIIYFILFWPMMY